LHLYRRKRLRGRSAGIRITEGDIVNIYSIENASLRIHQHAACKVDGHVHSRYSAMKPARYVATPLTKLIGVRESYSTPRKIHAVMKKRGMTFCTISDHDSVLGALEMRRKNPEDSFISCEYTVRINGRKEPQAIHVGVWGIDYPHGTTSALPEPAVLELHRDLCSVAKQGVESFTTFCRKTELAFCLNHPAWQGNPKRPLSGNQIDEITSAFPVLEVNGDCQLENLISMEIAMKKG